MRGALNACDRSGCPLDLIYDRQREDNNDFPIGASAVTLAGARFSA